MIVMCTQRKKAAYIYSHYVLSLLCVCVCYAMQNSSSSSWIGEFDVYTCAINLQSY